MSTFKKSIIVAAFLAAVGFGIYEASRSAHWRDRVQTLEQRQKELAIQVDLLQKEKEDAARQLNSIDEKAGQTNNQLAELLRLRGEVSRLRSDSDELAGLKAAQDKKGTTQPDAPSLPWIKRVNQLKQYLAQNPSQAIPEMRFAEVSAWLNSIQFDITSDDDLNRASFLFRNQSEMKFTGLIGEALRQFEQANNNQFPTALSQLVQYSDPDVGRTMLDLYEIAPRSTVKDPAFDATGDWIITRKTTVNPGSPLDRHLAVVGDGKRIWYEN